MLATVPPVPSLLSLLLSLLLLTAKYSMNGSTALPFLSTCVRAGRQGREARQTRVSSHLGNVKHACDGG